ncbi:hypothetical protein LEP1GSC033_3641 [Leptospira interrogans str. 2002000632]|nr:hypothetical protein LEP1GSC033_3641 [Leptospira interrogans str. 2002000632]
MLIGTREIFQQLYCANTSTDYLSQKPYILTFEYNFKIF